MNAINTIGYVDSQTEEEKAAEPVAASTPETFVYDSTKPVDTNVPQIVPNFFKNALMQKLAMLRAWRLGGLGMSPARRSMLNARKNAKVRKTRARAAMVKASRKRNRG